MLKCSFLIVGLALVIGCKSTRNQSDRTEFVQSTEFDLSKLAGVWYQQPSNEEMVFVRDRSAVTPSRFTITWEFKTEPNEIITKTPGPSDKPKRTVYSWSYHQDDKALIINGMGEYVILLLNDNQLKLK